MTTLPLWLNEQWICQRSVLDYGHLIQWGGPVTWVENPAWSSFEAHDTSRVPSDEKTPLSISTFAQKDTTPHSQ
jgi:hypothetical protein